MWLQVTTYESTFLFFLKHTHWKAMKYTIVYVKDTINYRITYHYGAKLQFIDFVNSDYTNNCNTRILTNGHVFYVEEVPVLWLTKRQETVVIAMTKAEYMAASVVTTTRYKVQ